MDSPDRMSWTPSSSAKKRKFEQFIDTCVHIRIPGAYPPSPGPLNEFNRSQYLISPTPPARFHRPGLSDQLHKPMLDYRNLPEPARCLFQMVANAGATAHAYSSSAMGILAGPGGQAAAYFQNNFGSLYAAVEAIGNTAKRIKLSLCPQPSVESPPTQQPSTPPRRISQYMHRTPTPAFRTQSSILRDTRETGLRKARKTLRWVEDQTLINDASNEMIDHHTSRLASAAVHQSNEQLAQHVENLQDPFTDSITPSDGQGRPAPAHTHTSFEPVMSGALPSNDSEAQSITTASPHVSDILSDDSDSFDMMTDDEMSNSNGSASSSDYSDSVTSSLLAGLTEEDLQGMETREEKKARKKQEARELKAARLAVQMDPNSFSNQLRAIYPVSPSPVPQKKNVAFYGNSGSGKPVTMVKEYSSEDALTPPIKPHNRAPVTLIRSSMRRYQRRPTTEAPVTPSSKASDSPHRLINTPTCPLVTPERVVNDLSDLSVSRRRSTSRVDEIAVEEQIKRDQAAAEEAEEADRRAQEAAAQRAAEEARQAEQRIRLGIRRMPTGAVIQPLTADWDDQVTRAMATGLSSQRELARTSAGESIRRRDFGHVLPQSGIDPPAGWLNDTIITAYLQAVVDYAQKARGVRRGALPKVHAFSTFFYTNLSERGYDSVRRWATRAKFGGRDLLNMEKIFIPINKGGNHWVLAHVNPQSKTIEYFDSFHGSADRVFDNIKSWLRAELRDAFVDAEWTLLQGHGPVQRNMSDCGVFCATTAKMIVLGVDPMAFSAADMPMQRRRMLAELINGGFEGDFEPNVVF
ncbi:MAG: hypothetical protein Q9219_001819 [cf. Caloplaca sp. 3 TL-2023]